MVGRGASGLTGFLAFAASRPAFNLAKCSGLSVRLGLGSATGKGSGAAASFLAFAASRPAFNLARCSAERARLGFTSESSTTRTGSGSTVSESTVSGSTVSGSTGSTNFFAFLSATLVLCAASSSGVMVARGLGPRFFCSTGATGSGTVTNTVSTRGIDSGRAASSAAASLASLLSACFASRPAFNLARCSEESTRFGFTSARGFSRASAS